MSENNEKILKRAAITEEEAGQVAGGRVWPMVNSNPSNTCSFCRRTGHTLNDCLEYQTSGGKCTICGSFDHAASICPQK